MQVIIIFVRKISPLGGGKKRKKKKGKKKGLMQLLQRIFLEKMVHKVINFTESIFIFIFIFFIL
jgi:hypothetical protein